MTEDILAAGAAAKEGAELRIPDAARDRRALERELRSVGNGYHASLDIAERIEETREAAHRLSNAKAMIAQAQSLPEGSPLHERLLADRGTASYQVKEGRGTVTRTYERGSFLGQELREAHSALDTRAQGLDRALETFRSVAARLRVHQDTAAAAAKAALRELGRP